MNLCVCVYVYVCIHAYVYRTNPKANVHLSGKKKRALMKEAKKLMREKEGEFTGH